MRRVGFLAGVLAAALVGGAAVPALAGPKPEANINATLGAPEVRGFAGDLQTVTVRQKRGGNVIAKRTVSADSSGFFEMTLKPVKAGDKLVVVVNGSRTVTVPKVRLSGNAATDTVSGHLPVPGDTYVGISNTVGTFSLGGGNPSFTTDSNGDFSGTYAGLQGADRLELRWSNAAGDAFTVELALTAADVQTGSAKVWLFGRPGASVTADLLAPNGTVRGTARGTIPNGFPASHATFRKNGSQVVVKPGDRVRMGRTVGLTVRTPDLAVGSLSALATCFPNQDWVLGTVFGAGAFSYLDNGTADGAGNVSATWLSALTSGTKVKLLCENAKGWTQDMVATFP